MTMSDALRGLSVDHRDEVAIAVSDQVAPGVASGMVRQINERLSQAGVPMVQRRWIIATTGDDEAAARTAAVVSDQSGSAPVIVHNPRDLDGLIFQRRIPGQRRGGIYLNHVWQSASARIACGEPRRVLFGLSAWFNTPARLQAQDLNADVVLGG